MGSLFTGLGFFLASFATEVWQLYFTQGIITGFGYSLVFIPSVTVLNEWFSLKRGLAFGIAVSGSGVGQFCMSLISEGLISTVGWRNALRYLALFNTTFLVVCSFMIHKRLPKNPTAPKPISFSNLKNPTFLIFFIGCLVAGLGLFMPFTYIPIYAEFYGINSNDAVVILSMSGITGAMGRIILGVLGDKYGKLNMLKFAMFSSGLVTLTWMACQNIGSIMTFGLFFGFFAGAILSLIPSCCADLFGEKHIGTVTGEIMSSLALGSLISAPIGGTLFDQYGDYKASITVAGLFLMISAFCLVFINEKDTNQREQTADPRNTVAEMNVIVSPLASQGVTSDSPNSVEIVHHSKNQSSR